MTMLADPQLDLDHLATEVLEVLIENDEARLATSREELSQRIPHRAEQIAAAVGSLVVAGVAETRDHLVQLTDEGRQQALARVRRHRLTARLLSDVIGLEWSKVHAMTSRWEQLVDDAVEARIVELLDDPGTCPHGNPIPGSANQPYFADAMLLDDAPVGPCRVVRVTQTLVDDDAALELLEAAGFIPGTEGEVKSNDSGSVQVAGTIRDVVLPSNIARHVVVAPR